MTGSLVIQGKYYHYKFRYKDPQTGKSCQTSITTKIPVQGNNKRKARQKGEELMANYIRSLSPDNWTFVQWVEKWIESKKANIRQVTYDGYCYYFSKHIKPFFGDKLLSNVKRIDLMNYYQKKLDDGLSPNSLPKHRVVIGGALKEAYLQEIIPNNPHYGITLPRCVSFEGTAYSLEQAQQLLTCVKGQNIETAVILGLCYGLRRSEVCGLRWSDIDFETNTMTIRNTVVHSKNIIELEKTKSKASNRKIDLVPNTIPYLKELQENQKRYRERISCKHKTKQWYVCSHKDGTRFNPDYISKAFSKFLKRSNLSKIRFHDLRHTAGSLLLEYSKDIKRVQKLLGHEKASTTWNTYIHQSEASREETANIMDNILFAV